MYTFLPFRFSAAVVVSSLFLAASCGYSQTTPQPELYILPENLPTIKTVVVSEPVRSSRAWGTGLAPNARGGWNFITQLYEARSPNPTEYVVLDLQSGKSSVFEGPVGQYTNSNYQWQNQIRAANGRIFFSEMNNNVTYYDPTDEKIKRLGQLIDPKDGDKFLFRMELGADGKIYGSTQSNGLPTVVQIDPETLQHKVIGKVGRNRLSYSYGYYLAVDLPWIYVAVGQTPWELAAINIDTGEHKILAERADAGWISLSRRAEGNVVGLTSGSRRPDARTDSFWLADGKMYPFITPYQAATLPFKPRSVQPVQGVLNAPPELDLTSVNADANGIGRVRWRPNGSKEEADWKDVQFKIQHTTPIPIETLMALPDGSLLGNARQYHGFFRYHPITKKLDFFGSHGPSGGPRTLVNGIAYIVGYPRSVFYAYDPSKPWTSDRRLDEITKTKPLAEANLNPRWLGNFANLTDTHYASYLLPSTNGRLYFAGRRERTGTGGGVGWYDPATAKYGGHHENLSFLKPRGLAVVDELGSVVYSGELQDDPKKPNDKPKDPQLVVYDMELKEKERLTVMPGLPSTGAIFNSGVDGVLMGYVEANKLLYLYDLRSKKVTKTLKLPAELGALSRGGPGGEMWGTMGNTLIKINPSNLAITPVGTISDAPEGVSRLVWNGNDWFFTSRAELRRMILPPPLSKVGGPKWGGISKEHPISDVQYPDPHLAPITAI